MKTSKLIGAQLDWAVAKCEELLNQPDVRIGYDDISFTFQEKRMYWRPSENWAQGGPIIESERLCLDIGHDGVWLAANKQNYDDVPNFMNSGPTPLIAAMRCYVASKLGDEVELPEELK
jgi:hypothetical protein